MRRNGPFAGAQMRFSTYLLICFSIGLLTMSQDSNADDYSANQEAIEVDSLPHHELGGNSVTVWLSDGIARLSLSNTLDMKYRGVGLVETQLSHSDLIRAKELHDELCKAAIEKSNSDIDVDPEMTYALRCMQNGRLEMHSGQFRELTRKIWSQSIGFKQDILKKYESDGRSIVKFDARVSDVHREIDKFVVAVKFLNSGRYPVRMATPDMWDKFSGKRLDISGFRVGGGGAWRADLAGVTVMNKDDYPVETITTMGESRTLVTIPAGETVTYKFLSVPAEKIPKGDYEFGALVYTSIYVSGVNGAGGTVNFVSDTRSTPFTFDTDFPSTPQEWKDYEERQRAKLSEHVIPSGHTVAEGGYYRLISDTGQRSRWVYEFKKGAPSYKKELIYDSKGEAFLGRPVWQWEADLARKTLCSPGEPCPREGRWVGIKFAHRSWTADEYYLYENRRFQAGETMSPVLGDGDSEVPYAHWKWLGA